VSSSKRYLMVGLGVVAVAAALFLPFWYWIVERVEVQPNEYLVVVHRWGKNLPDDEILAPDDSYKGIMLEEKTPGRYFLNPIFWSYERLPLVKVESGQCLVLTRKYGKRIPEERLAHNQILADKDERGIVAEVLRPGLHRINPYAYDYKIEPAVQVRADQVGVRTLKIGREPDDPNFDKKLITERYVVREGYQGVQRKPDPPGTYYLNPHVAMITPIEVQEHQVELADISFPSRDGFILKPHIKVVYAVNPEKAPELLIRISSEGKMHQEDATPEQINNNEILQRIILPHIRGYARIEGSNFDARDFIGTPSSPGEAKEVNHREQFQKVLLEKVKPKCEEVGIDIRNVTLASLVAPPELTDQISERDLARAKQEKNKTLIIQYKSDQTSMAAGALKPRATEIKKAETLLQKATTEAEQKLANEKLRLDNDLASAKLKLEAAKEEAKSIRFKGEAEAKLTNQENEAKVAGLRQAILGFSSVQTFAQFNILSKIGPALTEIFASDDSEFAKIIAAHMTHPPTSNGKSASGGSQGP
jgi:hypothetical protein